VSAEASQGREYAWPYGHDGTSPPAEAHEIDSLERALAVSLPADLRAFYRFSDGFNGVFDGRGNYARIHPLAEVLSSTTGYDVAAQLGLTLIGDNGGGYAFGLDHAVDPPRYVGLSLLAADRSEMKELGGNFAEFLALLAAGKS
jgi:cell wall assembly regulator SMI1